MLSQLPHDALLAVCDSLLPCELVQLSSVCRDFDAFLRDDFLWDAKLSLAAATAVKNLAVQRFIQVDERTVAGARSLALSLSGIDASAPSRLAYFHALPYIAEASASVLSILRHCKGSSSRGAS